MPSLRLRPPKNGAFTLLELLVVIGIIVVLTAVLVPAVSSLSKSSGRKAAINNLLGAVEQARAEAIKSGRSTYIVFPIGLPSGVTADRYNYRAYGIFEDNPADPSAAKQLTNWKTLPSGVSLRQGSVNALSTGRSFASNVLGPGDSFRYIQFNKNGEIETPPTNVSLTVFEGFVNDSGEVVTSAKDGSGNPRATETLTISRLTGRAVRNS